MKKILSIETVSIAFLIFLSAGFVYFFLDNAAPVIPAAALLLLLYLASILLPRQAEKTADFCFRYRWWLALAFFIICTALQLHGSSIGMYRLYLPNEENTPTTLFGEPRSIRSDEWAVQTPTFFSQEYNDFELYSDRMSLSPTNMVIDYYAPVWDITIIGKPLSWGYLLFGSNIGLSWYWVGQLVLLFMLSYEMFLIIIEANRGLSALGALMITLSPYIQWWFLPHMPIVILYAEGLFVIGYHFFTAESNRKRALLSAAAIIAVTGFCLSIFPSFQVPCVYIIIGLLASCLYRDRNRITFTSGNWLMIAVPVIMVGLILAHFFMTSRDAIAALMNTVYPGRRMCLGGEKTIASLFSNPAIFTLPYKEINYSNNCEVSDYLHFAPFFLVLAPRMFYQLKKNKENIAVGIALFCFTAGTAFYMVHGIPQWLAEVSFLRYCNRMNGIYGWCSAIFTVWGLAVILKFPDMLNNRQKIGYPLLYLAGWAALSDKNVIQYLDTIHGLDGLGFRGIEGSGTYLLVLETAVVSSVLFLALYQRKNLMSALIFAIMFLCGGTINPIERGTTAFTAAFPEVHEIALKEPDALWINCTGHFSLSNYLLSNYLLGSGARVVDATNFYYDEEKWDIIDPDRKFTEITNRYSNQSASLSENENTIELLWPDNLRFSITPETLQKLGIQYILSDTDYTDMFNTHDITFETAAVQGNYRIYKIE